MTSLHLEIDKIIESVKNYEIKLIEPVLLQKVYQRCLKLSDAKTAMTLVEEFGADITITTSFGYTILHILCFCPCEIFVEFCLKDLHRLSKIINEQDLAGNTPMHLAITFNNLEMIEILLSINNIDLWNKYNAVLPVKLPPIHYAVILKNSEIVQRLVEHNKDLVELSLKENDFTPVYFAITNGSVSIMKYLMNRGADLRKVFANKLTILHLFGNISIFTKTNLAKEVLRDLLYGPNNISDMINDMDSTGNTPIHYASIFQNKIYFKVLAEHPNIDICALNYHHQTPIQALFYDTKQKIDINFLRLSIPYQIDSIETRAKDGLTALLKAIKLERIDIVKVLIEIGKARVTNTYNENNIIHFIIGNDIMNESICQYIIYKANKIMNHQNNDGNSALHLAAIRGNYVCVRILLELSGINILQTTPKGDNALTLAIKSMKNSTNIMNYYKTITALLNTRNVHLNNSLDGSGYTPLTYACLYESKDIIEMLLGNGADIDHALKDGNRLLHCLAECPSISSDILELIINCCPNINIANNFDTLPIHQATLHKNYKFLEMILINSELDFGNKNILAMIDYSDFHEETLRLLFAKCPQWMFESRENAPLFLAIFNNNLKAVQMFFERDIDLDFENKGAANVLHSISAHNNVSTEIIEFIFNALNNIKSEDKSRVLNKCDINGATPLMYATHHNNVIVLDKLLQYSETNLLLQDLHGQTVLMVALNKDSDTVSSNIINKLINVENSLVNIPMKDGRVPLQYAISLERLDIIKILIEVGNAKMTWLNSVGVPLNPLDIIADHQVLSPDILKYFVVNQRILIKEPEKSSNILYQRPILFQWLFDKIDDDEIEYDCESHEVFRLLKNTDESTLETKIITYISTLASVSQLNEIKDNLELTFIQRCNIAGYYHLSKYLQVFHKLPLTDLWSYEKCVDENILEHVFSQPNITNLINQELLYRKNILHIACKETNQILLKYLLQSEEINVLHQDYSGRTALHHLFMSYKNARAKRYSIEVMLGLLLDKNIKILFIPDIHGVLPIDIVLIENQTNNFEIIINSTDLILEYTDQRKNNIMHIMGYSNAEIIPAAFLEFVMQKLPTAHHLVKQQNIDGNTPLHIFCIRGRIEFLNWLIRFCPEASVKEAFNLKNYRGETLLAAALHKNNLNVNIDLIKLLLQFQVNIVNEIDENGETPLHKAIKIQRADIIQSLLDNRADPDLIDFNENTILHFASEYLINEKFIETLHNIRGFRFDETVFLSVEYNPETKANYIKAVNLQSQRRILNLINRKNVNGNTALHLALKHKNKAHIKLLLSYETLDLSMVNSDDESALFLAVSCHAELEVVETILKRGFAMLDVPNKEGITPFRRAIDINRPELYSLFYMNGAKSQGAYEEYNLMKSISNVTHVTTEALMFERPSVEWPTVNFNAKQPIETWKINDIVTELADHRNKNAPLAYFARKIDYDPRSVLEKCDKYGNYLIYSAVEWNRRDLVKYLIDFGTGAFVPCNEITRKTPLHIFAEMSEIDPIMKDVLEFFLKHSQYIINRVDINGNTALHFAAKSNNIELIKILLNSNADKCILNKNNQTPLLYGLYENIDLEPEIIKLLYDIQSSNVPDIYCKTALIKSLEMGRLKIVETFFELDEYCVCYKDKYDNNIFHYLTFFKIDNPVIVKLLLQKAKQKKFRFNTCNTNTGDTPIHLAAQANNLQLLQLLLPKNIKNYKKNNCDETPLLSVLNSKNRNISIDVVKILVEKLRKTVLDKDGNGLLAVHKVMKLNNWTIFEHLISLDHLSSLQLKYKDINKNTLLHHLVIQSVLDMNIFRYVIKSSLKEEINEKNLYDETYLHLFVKQEDKRNVEQLKIVLNETDVDLTISYRGNSVLMLLLKNPTNNEDDLQIIQLLLEASPNLKNEYDTLEIPPLLYTIKKGAFSIAQLLLDTDTVLQLDQNQNNLCHYLAIQHQDEEILEFFMEANADLLNMIINVKNNDQNTPLHLAMIHNNPSFLNVILNLKELNFIDPEIKNKDGKSVYELGLEFCKARNLVEDVWKKINNL